MDWLDSLVGNSNDSDIALLTYQLLGIFYDTCEELTEENERLRVDCVKGANALIEEMLRRQAIKSDTVREMQEIINERLDKSVEGYSSEEIKSDVRDMVDKIVEEMIGGTNAQK